MAGFPDLDTPERAYTSQDMSGATLSRLNSIDRNMADLLATAKGTHELTRGTHELARETNELAKKTNEHLRDIDASLEVVVGLLEQIKNRLPAPN